MRDDPITNDPSLEKVNQIKERHEERLMSLPGVVGVAVGLSELSGVNQLVIKVYISSRLSPGEFPSELEGVRVEVEETREFHSL